MATPHAAAAGFHRPAQKTHGAGIVIPLGFQRFYPRLRFVGEQFRDDLPLIVVHPLRGAKADHLFRFQLDSQLGGNLFGGEVKAFTGYRDGDRPHQHDGAAVELAVNGLFINTADTAAVAVVDAVINAQRLRDNKVTADHVNMRTLQRRVIKAHRQAGGDIKLQQTRRLLHQLQRFGVGHAGMFMINRFVMMGRQVGLNLRAGAIDHDQPDAQAMQQADIVDDTGEIFMLNGFAAEHNDKRFSAMSINIGNRMAESLYQFGSTFLYHGQPSVHDYSLIVYFYSFIATDASQNFTLSASMPCYFLFIKRMFTLLLMTVYASFAKVFAQN